MPSFEYYIKKWIMNRQERFNIGSFRNKIWKTIEKRRKKHARLTYQANSLPLQCEFGRVALPRVSSNGPTDPLHISCICSIWKILRYDFLTKKRPKTIIVGIIVQDNKNSNLFIWPSMWTRLERAHCLETINNMWFLGKRERSI
jgi:hypothetical protein